MEEKSISFSIKNLLMTVVLMMLILILGLPQFGHAKTVKESYDDSLGWGYADLTEFKALPEFCRGKFLGQESPLHQKWGRRIGGDFVHFHHYCRGITFLRRGRVEFDKKKRMSNLKEAMKQMDYMIKQCSKNLNPIFWADFYKKKAEIYVLMGNYPQAEIERKKSMIWLKKK